MAQWLRMLGVGALCLSGCYASAYSTPYGGGVMYAGPSAAVVVTSAPPPARVVVSTPVPAPYPGAVWVQGHWTWNGAAYVWSDGYYMQARPGYIYVQPTWVQRPSGYVYTQGYWSTPSASVHIHGGSRRPHRVYHQSPSRGGTMVQPGGTQRIDVR